MIVGHVQRPIDKDINDNLGACHHCVIMTHKLIWYWNLTNNFTITCMIFFSHVIPLIYPLIFPLHVELHVS